MQALAIVKLLLMVAQYAMKWLSDRQLIDAGRHKAIAENLTQSMSMIDEARKIRAGITADNVTLDQLRRPQDRGRPVSEGDVPDIRTDLRR